jgi:MFS family permease
MLSSTLLRFNRRLYPQFSYLRPQALFSSLPEKESEPQVNPEKKGFFSSLKLPKFLLKENIVAKEGFNRWLIPPASLALHMSIGSVYAWSIFNEPLSKELGVLTSAPLDWSLSSIVPIFSTSIVFLGLSAALGGHWLEKVGPRAVGTVASFLWGGGFLVGSAGIALHSLPLLYLGYGVLGGCGLGLGYVSPVSTLIRWFPDKRGLATGLAIMGFGGGAIIGAPLKEKLLSMYAKAPTFVSPLHNHLPITTDELGRKFMEVGDSLKEVVLVSQSELENSVSGLSSEVLHQLQEGFYLVGSGNTGTMETFMTLGLGYFSLMLLGSFMYRVPPAGYEEKVMKQLAASSSTSSSEAKKDDEEFNRQMESNSVTSASFANYMGKLKNKHAHLISDKHVHIDQSLKTPQFYMLWSNLFLNVTAGIAVIGVAKNMVMDVFHSSLPSVVDGAFAALYVTLISVANMSGRLGWASFSDYIGRKNTFYMYFGLGIPLYLMIPLSSHLATTYPHTIAPLALFMASTLTIFSFYGGGFSTIPAYLADIFGTKYVGGIHGRLLTAWSSAGLVGPLLLTQLRERSVKENIFELAQKVDPKLFSEYFGSQYQNANLSHIEELYHSNAINIAKLMEIVPEGTVDPTPFLYTSTMMTMSGLLGLALVSNYLIQPVHPKHHLPDSFDEKKDIEEQGKK